MLSSKICSRIWCWILYSFGLFECIHRKNINPDIENEATTKLHLYIRTVVDIYPTHNLFVYKHLQMKANLDKPQVWSIFNHFRLITLYPFCVTISLYHTQMFNKHWTCWHYSISVPITTFNLHSRCVYTLCFYLSCHRSIRSVQNGNYIF